MPVALEMTPVCVGNDSSTGKSGGSGTDSRRRDVQENCRDRDHRCKTSWLVQSGTLRKTLAMTAGPSCFACLCTTCPLEAKACSRQFELQSSLPIAAEPRASCPSPRMKQAPMLRRRAKAATAKLRRPIATAATDAAAE